MRTERSSAMETVLIFRLGSLGDTVVALPCFHKIAQVFPDARRLVLTNVPVASNASPLQLVLQGSGLIHGTITYPVGMRNLQGIRTLISTIRDSGATKLIYLTARRSFGQVARDMAFFRLAGIESVVGAPLKASHRRHLVETDTGLEEHEAARLLRQLSDLGPVDLDDRRNWDLRLHPDEIHAASEAIRSASFGRFIAVHVGSKVPINFWKDEHWMILLGGISQKHPDLGLFMIGSADERDHAAKISGAWKGRAINLCGKLKPRESAAVIEQATLFMGHDSGPMHLAASRGTRCVAIFGNNNPPKRWHPYGNGHIVFHDMRGVNFVEPSDVLAAVTEAMQEREMREAGTAI